MHVRHGSISEVGGCGRTSMCRWTHRSVGKGKLPRRRIQRAFYVWLAGQRDSSAVRLAVEHRTDRLLQASIHGVADSIKIVLTYDVAVVVEREGQCWDILRSFDCAPVKTPGGYVCKFCSGTDLPRYRNREDFWRHQLFEPLGKWLRELKSARWLLCYSSSDLDGGFVWAKLSNDKVLSEKAKQNLVAALPVHADNPAAERAWCGVR